MTPPLNIGDTITFLGSPQQGIPAQDGHFTITHYMPGGQRKVILGFLNYQRLRLLEP